MLNLHQVQFHRQDRLAQIFSLLISIYRFSKESQIVN